MKFFRVEFRQPVSWSNKGTRGELLEGMRGMCSIPEDVFPLFCMYHPPPPSYLHWGWELFAVTDSFEECAKKVDKNR